MVAVIMVLGGILQFFPIGLYVLPLSTGNTGAPLSSEKPDAEVVTAMSKPGLDDILS